MKRITIRSVKEAAMAKARKRARERGVSIDTVLGEALEIGLGVHPESSTNRLERFAGDSDFGPEWESRMREFDKVNSEGWK